MTKTQHGSTIPRDCYPHTSYRNLTFCFHIRKELVASTRMELTKLQLFYYMLCLLNTMNKLRIQRMRE